LAIAHGLADLVGEENIHLSEPVQSINDRKGSVAIVTTNGKTFVGKKAIISIPSALFKDIHFTPALPAALQERSSNAKLGHYSKAIVYYDKP
jgi:monoamine oxidase